MTTSKKHAELKRLSQVSKDSLYERLRLTDEILGDKTYCDRNGGEDKLFDALASNEWSDFAGYPGLEKLLEAYRANPQRAKWDEYRHNWQAMIELAQPESDRVPEEPRTSWKEKYLAAMEENEQLKTRVALLEDLLARHLKAA